MGYTPHVSSDPIDVRSGSLGTSFDASPKALRAQNWNQAIFYFDLTLGAATDARVQIDVASPSGDAEPTAWSSLVWQDGSGTSIASGVCTVPVYTYELKFSASGRYAVPVPLNYKWVRLRAKATGAVATLVITATTGLA
jgi:hypothetical protein